MIVSPSRLMFLLSDRSINEYLSVYIIRRSLSGIKVEEEAESGD